MTHKINSWWQNRRKKELEKEKQTAKESILHLLLFNKETEESLEIFEDIKDVFTNAMQRRLEEVTNEKSLLEKFLL